MCFHFHQRREEIPLWKRQERCNVSGKPEFGDMHSHGYADSDDEIQTNGDGGSDDDDDSDKEEDQPPPK
ncbi:Hypothetical predicted protein [Olea europaea subsp. europaea]|uniref:Uncharacterized protein n=1 Tax=Olea europaea subsp. europaea TaxID=158383 RepID=A0A8S0P7R4_OLEEU|nr:Hypothetical predicted protein [Olea europaea subsp. europaea]